jgi:hypothetical protein
MTRTTCLTAAVLLSSTLFASPTLVHNSTKYRDSGIPNATGRSGTATITAQALLNRDGSTDLELTTGDTGSIARVQLKLETGTRNYDGTAGNTFSLHLDDPLARHSVVQVQSNVRGIDGHRTDVVTVDETVKLRPDLVAAALDAPPRAFAGVPLTITGIAGERNGDTGARADCVLRVDGVEADRATGIWVDAGDSVTCQFEHTFEAAGDRLVELRLEGVAPGDWNDANNAVTQVLTVVAPSAMPEWLANGIEETWQRYRKVDSPFEHSETRDTGFRTASRFYGYVKQSAVDFDSLVLDYHEVSGGTVFVDAPGMTPFDEFTRGWQRCKEYQGDGSRFTLCSPGFPKNFPFDEGPTDLISIEGSRHSSDITYLSSGTSLSRGHPVPRGQWYSWNGDYTQFEGKQDHYGPSIEMTVRVRDGVNAVEARPSVVLVPFERHIDQPYQCGGGNVICRAESDHTVGKSGSTSFNW